MHRLATDRRRQAPHTYVADNEVGPPAGRAEAQHQHTRPQSGSRRNTGIVMAMQQQNALALHVIEPPSDHYGERGCLTRPPASRSVNASVAVRVQQRQIERTPFIDSPGGLTRTASA